MKPESSRQLPSVAREILLQNRRGNFSTLCHRLYPFQWNRDSGFVSIGLGCPH